METRDLAQLFGGGGAAGIAKAATAVRSEATRRARILDCIVGNGALDSARTSI